MSAEIFAEYRARLVTVWVDLQSCVLLLKNRNERRRRWATRLTWATTISSILTGTAAADVLEPVFQAMRANEVYMTSLLAFITAALATITQGAGLDAKIVKDTEAQHELLERQKEAVDHLTSFSRKALDPSDDETVSIFEAKVDQMVSKKNYETALFRDDAMRHSDDKHYLKRAWIGPPNAAAAEVEAQGVADLQPLRRG